MTVPRVAATRLRGVRREVGVRMPELLVRRLSLFLLAVLLLSAGWLWLRDASVVAVEEVRITGLRSSQQEEVREALRRAALGMTTLHVREDDLRAAVASFNSVQDIRADGEFPNTLAIEVVERRMVGVVRMGDTPVPVGVDGRLLHGVQPRGAVAEIDGGRPAGRAVDAPTRQAVSILAQAPRKLHPRIERVRRGPRGLTLQMERGPDLIFGNASRIGAKWAAAARVLAEPSAVGAVYLDLRMPERVAAGGVAPLPDPSEEPVPPPAAAPSAPPADAAQAPQEEPEPPAGGEPAGAPQSLAAPAPEAAGTPLPAP